MLDSAGRSGQGEAGTVDVGQRLRRIRKAAGISQRRLAMEAGISQSGLSSIEAGTQSPSVKTLSLICKALGIEIADLFQAKPLDSRKLPKYLEPLIREVESLTPEQAKLLARFIASMRSK